MGKSKIDPSVDIAPDAWMNHFKSLFNMNYATNFDPNLSSTQFQSLDNAILNKAISIEEFEKAIRELKNGKACGCDAISNEMLKLSSQFFIKDYVFLMNCILQTGFYPDIWRENIIKPVYKGGGSYDPSNYRGIAISSCFSKLFSKVLFNRLDCYIETNNIIGPEQIGFRKQCRTSDHVLTLKTLIDKAFKSKRYLYSCFVDLSKAFDTINREALFYKLAQYNITGPFYNIIKDMYSSLHCSVKMGNFLSDSFATKTGVKQGCILSPSLFSLYLNDLLTLFDGDCDQVQIGDIVSSCLLYADDIVLLSNSSAGLQVALDKLSIFCTKWNLKVNISKTKVIIFNKAGKTVKGNVFKFDGNLVEIVNEYKYLGIIFKPSGTFTDGINYLCKKALKASFCIRKAIGSDKMNTPLFLKLYEQCVKPILLYCSEVWAGERLINQAGPIERRYDTLSTERIQLKFCKFVLGVHKSASNIAVRAELGLFPIALYCLRSSISFWLHIIESDNNKLVRKAYNESCQFIKGFGSNLKVALNKLNFTHVWDNQDTFSKSRLMNAVTLKLKESYTAFWKNKLFDDSENPINGNKLRTYRKFKTDYSLEKYLLSSDNSKEEISTFCKLRLSAHKLFIEEGRYKKVPLNERICKLCRNDIEDEEHFIFDCIKLEHIRKHFFHRLASICPSFIHMSKIDRLKFVLGNNEYDLNVICLTYLHDMYTERTHLLSIIG